MTHRTVDSDGEEFGTWGSRVDSVTLRGLLGWTKHSNGDETVYGLVPDGNEVVTLHLLHGEPIRLPVIENVFIGRSNGPACSLNFVDGRGHPDQRRWREHL